MVQFQVYSGSRAFVPSALHSSVRVVENKVTELGTPLLTAVQTRSEQVLTSLDRKVSPQPSSTPLASCLLCKGLKLPIQALEGGLAHLGGGLALMKGFLLQVDNALTAAQNVLFPKGLDTAVATSRQQHAANVEAANEAREAYLKKVTACCSKAASSVPRCLAAPQAVCLIALC